MRLALLPVLAAGLALPAAILPPEAAQAASACRATGPAALRAQVTRDGAAVTLRWRGASSRRLAFRVLRDGQVIGQTHGHAMRVAAAPGPHRFAVWAVLGSQVTRCQAALRRTTKARPGAAPGPTAGLSATPVGAEQLRLSWTRATAGALRIAGYDLVRDGATVRRVHGLKTVVPVASDHVYRYQVAAVDTHGRRGPLSSTVTVRIGHAPPTAPVALAVSGATDTTATLSWGPAQAVRGRIAGYRLYRDGKVTGTVKGTSVRIENLASAHRFSFAVQAVDTLGWTSALSAPVTVVTGHTAPAPPAGLTATDVSDTRLVLRWNPAALPAGSALRGYRLVRDGVVVSQVKDATAAVGNLAGGSRHTWTVATVDTLGYVSAPSAPLDVTQAAPPATRGSAQAFLLASTGSSFRAFQAHYQQVGVVYPTYFDCNTSTADLEGTDDPLVTQYAQARQVKVLPRVNCQDAATLHRILTDTSTRARWLRDVPALVEAHGYDGVIIDFETAPGYERPAMTSFITDLAARLHANGRMLAQAVSAKTQDVPNHPRSGAFDYVALSQPLDYVVVMGWGIHWATSAPGAQDDVRWVRQVQNYVATMPHPEKWVMGTMLYGMDWAAGGGAAHPATALHYDEITALVARTGATPVYDPDQDSWHVAYTDASGVPHDLWYSDAAVIARRIAIARSHGFKTALWRIGQEDESLWNDPLLAPGV